MSGQVAIHGDQSAVVQRAVRRAAILRRFAWLNWRRLGLISLLAVILAGSSAAYVFRPLDRADSPALDGLHASAENGRYLATIGNCAACHTTPEGRPFAGGVRFETPFGVIHSTNITPDRSDGIGLWSFADFYTALKHGVRPDGTHLYPAFPYSYFARLSDADIASLYLYLRSVAPASTPNRANRMIFPFGHRELLYFWKRLFHDGSALTPQAGRSAAWNRGAYLVEGLAHCGACHTPRNMLGGSDKSEALQGGTYTDKVASGEYRKWSAADLTPGPRGLGRWSRKDVADYLMTGKNPHAVAHGPMTEVISSTRHLTPRDADAIATYLRGIPSSGRGGLLDGVRLPGGRAGAGEVVYTVHCGTCHLPDGKGDRILGVPLGGSPIVQARDPSSLINVILYGPDLPPPPFSSGRTRMPPFGKRLSNEDIASLATYLRSAFGNRAGSVTPEEVERQR